MIKLKINGLLIEVVDTLSLILKGNYSYYISKQLFSISTLFRNVNEVCDRQVITADYFKRTQAVTALLSL